MHRILRRQIERHIPDVDIFTSPMKDFIEAVDVAYDNFDEERELMERSISISSRELRDNEALFKELLNSLDDGMVVADLEGRVVYFNTPFVEICALPENVVKNRNLLLMFTHIIDATTDTPKFGSILTSRLDIVEKMADTLHFADNKVLDVRSRPQLLNGQIVGRVWTFRDISERVVS